MIRNRKSKPRVKVQDVAAEAKVSVATVSRAFNQPDVVSEDVRARVAEVAERLGYRPHAAARALRSRKTHLVGAIIPSLDAAIYARMVDAFQERFAEYGYMTVVLTTGFNNQSAFEKAKLLIERGAEALVFVGAIEDPHLRKLLETSGVPAVTTYSHLPRAQVPSIGFDNGGAMESVIDHLTSLGHHQFALVSAPPEGNDRQRARIEGFRAALRRRNLAGAERVFSHPYSISDGAAAMREVYAAHRGITAIVCTADIHAFGVLAECRRIGVQVPGDVSVTGFDDAEYAGALQPTLTTIAVPADEMGTEAAESLHHALVSGKRPVGVQLKTRLIVRESSGVGIRQKSSKVTRLVRTR